MDIQAIEMVKVPEAARRLGLSRQWLLRLLTDGRIPQAKRRGRHWLLPTGPLEVLPPPPPAVRTPPPRSSRVIEIPGRKPARRTLG